ncbi:MAG TPA: glycosyltransferase family 4 protein [Gaiellaceae bacterium]|nr:glycosyltransferase family 4 protein [Gaiellaceae bacterium]
MRFAMVTTFYPPYHFGGDAMHAYRLTNALARRGHQVTVVHSEDAYRALGGGEPAGSFPHEPGVTLRPLRTALPLVGATATYLSGRPALYGRQLDEVFGKERFDVVHFHNVSLAGGPGVLRYGEGVKLYTTSEHWLVCPMHVLFRDNREPCVEPHCLRCTLTFRRPPQLWRYTRLLERELPNVDLFLSPSRFTKRAHEERGFTRPIRHLPYFLPDVLPAQAADRERPYFLFVGRLERLKGVQVLIEAFRSYREADLLIVGDGEYRGELERTAAGLDHVRFLGRVHPSELAPLYAGAISLLVPSVGYEVFGIVILEGFAQRTPAIVNDLGALPEVVEESGGGLVYRTPAELVEAMEALRTDPDRRRALGEAGHGALGRLWCEEAHVEQYFARIEEARRIVTEPSTDPTKLGRS